MPSNQYSENGEQQHTTNQEWMKFFDAMDEVFFSYDWVNTKLIQVSHGCEILYGYKAADFFANDGLWLELIHPDDRHIVAGEDERLKQGNQVVNQLRIIRKDGTVRWVERKIVPTLDEAGKLIRTDGIVRDITNRKESDEKHVQSDSFYRRIVEIAQEGIWIMNENDITTFVNQKLADILGYTVDEIIGKTPYDFMSQAEQARAKVRIGERKQGHKAITDAIYVAKNGKEVLTNLSANPILDDNGQYKGALAMITDITQQRLDEESLRKSEANLRTIFDNTDTSYVLINDDMTILSFNGLAQKYSQAQNGKDLVINQSVRDYFLPERLPYILEILEKVKRDGIADYELTFTKSDGTVKWHNVRWLIVKNNEGQHCGYILSNKDITEAKLAALERERITTDLIQHNKDLEQFTYIISHNLRAPVANIIGLTEILSEPVLDAEMKHEIAQRISLSIKSVDAVISDLNHILQARKPGREVKESVVFEDICTDIKQSISDVIRREKVQIICSFEEVGDIYTIRSYMYSIFYNLVTNSIKYCIPGTAPFITIKSFKLQNKIELRFKDNGKGIDLQKNGHNLFGLYKRFDTTVEGKGMGLFMVKTQVEALGGTIRIDSKLGEGTEFIMQFSV